MKKTFLDLEFRHHHAGYGLQAIMQFENGYGVSVLFGEWFYSNGINTFEVGIIYNQALCYSTPLTNDVIGYVTADRVTEIMSAVQDLPAQ